MFKQLEMKFGVRQLRTNRMILVVMIASWGFVSQDVRNDFLQNPLKCIFLRAGGTRRFLHECICTGLGCGEGQCFGVFPGRHLSPLP